MPPVTNSLSGVDPKEQGRRLFQLGPAQSILSFMVYCRLNFLKKLHFPVCDHGADLQTLFKSGCYYLNKNT